MGLIRFVRSGGRIAWILIASVVIVSVASTMLFANTLDVRYRRDISRIVFNHNTGLLDQIRREIGESRDSPSRLVANRPEGPTADKGDLVVSIAAPRIWYRPGGSALFTPP